MLRLCAFMWCGSVLPVLNGLGVWHTEVLTRTRKFMFQKILKHLTEEYWLDLKYGSCSNNVDVTYTGTNTHLTFSEADSLFTGCHSGQQSEKPASKCKGCKMTSQSTTRSILINNSQKVDQQLAGSILA